MKTKMVMLVSMNGYDNEVVYDVKEIESLNFDVFKDWELIDENVWCCENDVIVVSESEELCLKKLKEIDVEFGDEYVYVKKEEKKMCDWILSLKSN